MQNKPKKHNTNNNLPNNTIRRLLPIHEINPSILRL